MKFLSLIAIGIILNTGCTSSEQKNQTASDTSSVFDSNPNSSLDTSDQTGDTSQSDSILIQESNGKQSPRTNVGTDTTGKQEHDDNLK